MKKKNVSKGATPSQMAKEDDMLSEYDIDYSKAKPNRFAGKNHVVIGPVSDNYEKMKRNRTVRKSPSNGAHTRENLVPKRAYLYPHQIKILARVDKNFSAAIRKVVDAYKK